MTIESDKTQIIEQIMVSLEHFQKELGSVSGSDTFFSSVTKLQTLNKEELTSLLYELWEKNIQSALDRLLSRITQIEEAQGDIGKFKSDYNKFKRELIRVKADKDEQMVSRIKKYNDMFKSVVGDTDSLKDNRQLLIKKGREAYLKVYALYASIVVVLYSTFVGFYYKGNLTSIGDNIVLLIILLGVILWFLWVKLHNWINKSK